MVKDDYDHCRDDVPTNLLSDFNGDTAADDKPNLTVTIMMRRGTGH